MGENPPWVEEPRQCVLAQPHDVMDSVQRLRAIAQQTGTLKSTPQQKVIVTPAAPVSASSTAATSTTHSAAPAPTQVIKIEPTNPQVVYVPSYNPSTVYGTWPNSAYPPVYLPRLPGSSLLIASSKASVTAWAWPLPGRCLAVSTGMMMMTTTITMTTITTAITRIMAITSILI